MRLLKAIWGFIRSVQSVIGTLLFFFLLLIVIASLRKEAPPLVPNGGALVLDPHGVIVEQRRRLDILADMVAGRNRPHQIQLRDVLRAIRGAAADGRIKALFVDLNDFDGGGMAQLQEIGAALEDFRKTGKIVIATATGYTQGSYLLAAHADQIFVHPLGGVMLSGFAARQLYFKDALDKLKADIFVFKTGRYKSAFDPFTRNDMSKDEKIANQALIDTIWNDYRGEIAKARKIAPAIIDGTIAGLPAALKASGGNAAKLALDAGLVTAIGDSSAASDAMKKIVGADKDGFRGIAFEDYLKGLSDSNPASGGTVGIVVVEGQIVDGDQQDGSAAAGTIAGLIREAREEKKIKALVLRVDSPGGSVTASDLIRREVQKTRAAGIPVVVSMASVAASGGYWISAEADEIVAAPTTITGSIGVIGMYPNFTRTLDKLGVHEDGVATSKLAGAFSVARPLSDEAQTMLQSSIDFTYAHFLDLVSKGRHLPVNTVASMAEGRVWAGRTAKDLKLVDKLGSLDDAIKDAAAKARIVNPEVIYIEEAASPADILLRKFLGSETAENAMARAAAARDPLLTAAARQLTEPLAMLRFFDDPHHAYAICMTCNIR